MNLQNNNDDSKNQMRLQVFMAKSGVASRRACEHIIAEGRVCVNGKIETTPGTKVSINDKILVDGKEISLEEENVYVLLNKPSGYVCSANDEKGREVALDLLKPHFSQRLYNVGRLDMYSCGLIIFTNDGEFAAKISHPSSQLQKEYLVEATTPIPQELIDKFQKGIRIDNVFYKCQNITKKNSKTVNIVLIEGKNREIRRVFEFFDLGIKRLIRVRIGNIQMNGLPEGKFRQLSSEEVQSLLKKDY